MPSLTSARSLPDFGSVFLLNNLGTGLSDRYKRTGRLEDLEEAIRCYRQACGLGAIAGRRHSERRSNWGAGPAPRQLAGGGGGPACWLPAARCSAANYAV
ncbi:MAG: tetratricopeptide repeat protein [Caldilinea sp.]|nr:tetratricopeptide repeat protein [Caldilinea sp.]